MNFVTNDLEFSYSARTKDTKWNNDFSIKFIDALIQVYLLENSNNRYSHVYEYVVLEFDIFK